jgi:hypothetical protein
MSWDEDQTVHKTWEWFRENKWVPCAEEFERREKEEFEQQLRN